VDSSYVNPIANVSDIGPFPANMTRRDAFRQPGVYNVDLGVYKTIKLTERYSLQLRGEAYNLFNHSNLYVQLYDAEVEGGVLDAKRGSPAGATILGDQADFERRNLQLAVKFIF
jgi:hypothetical protein